ncbi:MAG TPA: peptidoglycan-binding protein, partial [Devosia sp.]|nr:peptidoglycan-binding protein [Devosia sp.]
MTVEAYSSLPLQAGSALAATAARTARWAISVYMRQPLRNTAVAALVGLSAMAGANALYKQAHHHPAPLFGSFEDQPAAKSSSVAPVTPLVRPRQLDAVNTDETTGSVDADAPTPAVKPIDGADIMAAQKKLIALNFLNGNADGLFGAHTIRAIKAFEQKAGLPARGQLTPALLAMLVSTPVPAGDAPALLPAPRLAPAQPATNGADTLPPPPLAAAATDLVKPLPAPAPLTSTSTLSSVEPPPVATPLAAVAAATGTELIPPSSTQTLAMNEPALVARRPVQTIAVHVSTPAIAADAQPIPSPLAPATEGTDDASTNPGVVAEVQRGLSSLGFLHGEA